MSIKFNCKKCINWECWVPFCTYDKYNQKHRCKTECIKYGKALYCKNEELEALANEKNIDNYCKNYEPKNKVP